MVLPADGLYTVVTACTFSKAPMKLNRSVLLMLLASLLSVWMQQCLASQLRSVIDGEQGTSIAAPTAGRETVLHSSSLLSHKVARGAYYYSTPGGVKGWCSDGGGVLLDLTKDTRL